MSELARLRGMLSDADAGVRDVRSLPLPPVPRSPKDPQCEGGCTFPIIDFDSGTDEIYVCGEPEHGARTCVLATLPGGRS